MHSLLMHLAGAIRRLRKWFLLVVLVGGLMALNLATLLVSEVYDFMSQRLWSVLAQASDAAAQKRPKSRAELEAEARQARVDADGAKADTARVQAQLDAAEARSRRLQLDLDGKGKRLSDLEAEAARSAKRSRQVTKNIATIRDRVTASIRRNSSAEVAEMVPLLGYVFTLGAMAYDVNDACQQLNDLEALERSLSGAETKELPYEAICLKSFEQIVSLATGEDPGYAVCVKDRLNTREMDPPSCANYDDALPEIGVSDDAHLAEEPDLPQIE